MSDKLILFLDTDYIVPVVDHGDGNVSSFKLENESSLWLYFQESPHVSELNHGRFCKSCYESGQRGYYGDFWKNTEQDVPYGDSTYCDLLLHAGILRSLKRFFRSRTGKNRDFIPTIFIFSGNISLPARKKFLDYMEGRDFEIISYSVSFQDLVSHYLLSPVSGLRPEFGDKYMLLQSSGKDLLMSYCTFDGDFFLLSEPPEKLTNLGNDPVKKGLVKYVVDRVDAHHNFLSDTTREQEYAYQMQFADHWLSLNRDGISFTIGNFHYSSDPSITYSCKVNWQYIQSLQETTINNILQTIHYYKNNHTKNNLIRMVLLGEAFHHPLFQDKINRRFSDPGGIQNITLHDIPDILSYYQPDYGSLRENLDDFDLVFDKKERSMRSIAEWVNSAEVIRLLKKDFHQFHFRYTKQVNLFTEKLQVQQKNWESAMKKSFFSQAKECLSLLSEDLESIRTLEKETRELEIRSQHLSLTYDRIIQFEGAKKIIEDIKKYQGLIPEAQFLFQSACSKWQALNQRTLEYEKNYPHYQRLLKELKDEKSSYTLREQLMEEIRFLTMEDLPVFEMDEIEIRIEAEVVKTGSFFHRKKHLKLSISLPAGRTVECRSVLLIAPRVMVRLNRGCSFTEDFPPGISGTITREYELPLSGCGKTKELFIYFWPHEDELVSINTFSINLCSIKL